MNSQKVIREEIEKVEEAYEYMLAYAAQGRADEGEGAEGTQIRIFIKQFLAAVEVLSEALAGLSKTSVDLNTYISGFNRESDIMASILKIILANDNISSEVIDNANGLISVRSYLTSLFFIDKSIL
ncbi:MAG: hypothetical protein VX617_04525 [Pseudomonadota bacterium]|nr:hypothetical protein [Pseudomonadota bacterium]